MLIVATLPIIVTWLIFEKLDCFLVKTRRRQAQHRTIGQPSVSRRNPPGTGFGPTSMPASEKAAHWRFGRNTEPKRPIYEPHHLGALALT